MVEELRDGQQEWLWRRKSSENIPEETESSGSASPRSERYADDQDGLRDSPTDSSPIDTFPSQAQSPEISSNAGENEVQETVKNLSEKSSTGENGVQETVKSLSEKLSAALLNISAKEDLVKQHSKVAEEAVSGWEKAESEVAVLKQQLEATSQKNSALEDKISHLDGALKECVRQLRQSREEQKQKVHDAVTKKAKEWECNKSDLVNQLIELKKQLETSKAEDTILVDNLQSKLEAIEKENAAVKVKFLTLSEELKIRTLERELSTQTAETASKQNLESIKKVAKLEAECRKLRAVARKTSSVNDHETISSSAGVESLTYSQSDNGDRLLGMDNEPSCSDSWASALISELDQFKNEKARAKVLTSSVDIDLMDDFLEMERLASMPEADNGSSSFGLEADSNRVSGRESSSKVEDDVLKQKMAELEEKVIKLETEKAKLETALADTQNQLESPHNQLSIAEGMLVQLRKDLELAKESKQAAKEEAVTADAKRKVLESQLKSTVLELEKLKNKVVSLEGKVEESMLSSELKTKLETSEATREAVESQLHLAHVEVENLRKKLGLFEGRIEEERARSTEFAAKADAAEAMRKAMESQFLSADLEVRKLQQEVNLLQQRIEDEVSLSAVEGERKALEYELELAHSEVRKLSDKVGLLEEEVDNERTLSIQFAAKCKNLEDELSKKRREAEVRVVSCSNGEISVKQEKELAMAAEKLAECQKTIASLGRQLKSLTTLDDFMLESEKSELNGGSPNQRSGDGRIPNLSDSLGDITISTLSNGKEGGSPQSPPSSTSMLSGIERL